MKDGKHIKKNGENHDELLPFMKELKERNPYTVPEDYFEKLPGKIKIKIAQQQIPAGKTRSLYMKYVYTLSLAAAVVTLLIMFYFIFKPGEKDEKHHYLASNEQEFNAIEDYLLNNSGIDEESITEAMTGNLDSIPDLMIVNPLPYQFDSIIKLNGNIMSSGMDTSVTPDDIIQYLLDEDFDSEIDL